VNLFKAEFNSISCSHIYREYNYSADQLSKEAAILPRGEWVIQEQRGADEFRYYHQPYIDQHYQGDLGPWITSFFVKFWNTMFCNLFDVESDIYCRNIILKGALRGLCTGYYRYKIVFTVIFWADHPVWCIWTAESHSCNTRVTLIIAYA